MHTKVVRVLISTETSLHDTGLRVKSSQDLLLVRRLQASGCFGFISPGQILLDLHLSKERYRREAVGLLFPAFEKGKDGFWRTHPGARSVLVDGEIRLQDLPGVQVLGEKHWSHGAPIVTTIEGDVSSVVSVAQR